MFAILSTGIVTAERSISDTAALMRLYSPTDLAHDFSITSTEVKCFQNRKYESILIVCVLHNKSIRL